MEKRILLNRTLGVFLLCAVCIVVRLVFMSGFYLVSDDDQYSQAAYKISQGIFQIPTNHWNARIGMTFSDAAFYALMGVNEYSAAGASLLFSLLNILLLFLFAYELFERKNWFKIGVSSAVLFIFVPLSVELGTSIQVRHGQTFFMFAAIYFLLRGEKKARPYHYVMSGICGGIAYLFHETGLFIFLTMLTLAAYFMIKGTFHKSLWLVVLGLMIVLACENIMYSSATHKLFYRQTIALQTHFRISDTGDIGDITEIQAGKLKTIENPFSGTFLGDSWFFEPFREMLFEPTYSIIYHLFFLVSIMLAFRKDKYLLYLSLLFWPLFLYFNYGSQSPFAYRPLRRLPGYFLPCLFPVSVTVGYGIECLVKRKYLQNLLLVFFVGISLLCSSIKGGDIPQRFHQSKFFYAFMEANPAQQFIADSVTAIGLKFLSTYQDLGHVNVMRFPNFIQKIQEQEFLKDHKDSYVFINVPEIYGQSFVHLDETQYLLIAEHERKPRKICYIPGIRDMLKNNLCDLSNGGQIYKIR